VVLLSERLLQAMGEPLRIQDTEVTGSVSIGVTTSAIGYTDPEAVLRDADIAMYRAKAGGKARYALFDVSLHSDVSQRLRLEGDLRHAIATPASRSGRRTAAAGHGARHVPRPHRRVRVAPTAALIAALRQSVL
jgi:hypothetical protein